MQSIASRLEGVPYWGAEALVVACRMGDTIYVQGDPAEAAFVIQTGNVKLTVMSKDGREAVLEVLNPGSFFGEGCLTSEPRRPTTATALTTTSLLRITKATMVTALRTEPDFSARLVEHLLDRTIRVEEELVDRFFNCSEKRLARLLIRLASAGEDQDESVLSHLSQETLAKMVGTTRSRVSFFMNRFRRLGFIDYDRRDAITVDPSRLTVVIGD
jgi:CRP/FNR family transcriptional regulator, cyclic AMP receptor protein